ncbi:pilus assembly protein N-terminal domain-containing protein [Spiroplasma chrysopicola]|uniref:pilus assembly protein N-terminal domain-containing protein n=1 Tax=Spiroplasma chrysopicola TaxID=216933 RepID=UPI0003A669CA|nr:pilus assembly protein N-terminal domain-containing protein [Spiroplasma chrysopicola]
MDSTRVELLEKQTDEVTIKNFNDLKNVKIVNWDESLISVFLENNKILITGIKVGETTINIVADNKQMVEVSVKVHELIKKQIILDKSAVSMKEGFEQNVLITNYSQFVNIRVSPKDYTIVDSSYKNGTINIFGKKVGTTIINIVADNGYHSLVTVSVNPNPDIKENIILNANSSVVRINTISVVNILNYSDLKNIQVSSDNSLIARVALFNDDIIIIGDLQGSTIITVTADNGNTTSIATKVVQQLRGGINTSSDSIIVEVGKSTDVKITNFISLTNVKVWVEDINIINYSIFDNAVIVKAINVGSTSLLIRADNGFIKVVTVRVIPKSKININLDSQNASVQTSNIVNVNIINFIDLENVEVSTDNSLIANAELVDNVINIIGIAQGTTNIIVTADNAYDNQIAVTVEPRAKINIDLSASSAIVDVDSSTNVQILNFIDLVNPQVAVFNSSIASVTLEGSNILVTGISYGETTITITASNGISNILNVIVNQKQFKTINLERTEITITETASANIVITNFADLSEIKLVAQNNLIADISLEDDTIIIKGLTVGTTSVLVGANDAFIATIDVTVNPKEKIDINLLTNSTTIEVNSNTNVEIINFNELENIQLLIDDSSIVNARLIDNNINITGLAEGTTVVKVKADNGKTTSLTIIVNSIPKINIQLSSTSAILTTTKPTSVSILNFDDLINPHVWSNNEEIAIAHLANNKVNINGKSLGIVIITVTADNANSVNIAVTVTKSNTKIKVDYYNLTAYVNNIEIINIINFDDLVNVWVHSTEQKIGSAILEEDRIVIIGYKPGTFKIIVNADNALPIEINITIIKTKNIY